MGLSPLEFFKMKIPDILAMEKINKGQIIVHHEGGGIIPNLPSEWKKLK
jgi:hypothetical protein